MGLFAVRLAHFVRNPWVRRGAGALLIAYGAWRLVGIAY